MPMGAKDRVHRHGAKRAVKTVKKPAKKGKK
jgi:hypothetical protein